MDVLIGTSYVGQISLCVLTNFRRACLFFLCAFWSISDEFVGAFFGEYVGKFPMDIMCWSNFYGYVTRWINFIVCVR